MPLRGRVGPAEKVDGAVLIAPTDEDHQRFQRRVQIERETLWKRASRESAVTAVRCFASVCCDVSRRYAHERCDIAAVMTLPDLALPQGIETFDGVLQSRLARWRKHRYDPSAKHRRLTRPTVSANWCGP